MISCNKVFVNEIKMTKLKWEIYENLMELLIHSFE